MNTMSKESSKVHSVDNIKDHNDNKSYIDTVGNITNEEYYSDDDVSIESHIDSRDEYANNDVMRPLKIKKNLPLSKDYKSLANRQDKLTKIDTEDSDSKSLTRQIDLVRANLQKLHHNSDLDHCLTTIDLDSFEKYLKDPQYIKIFRRKHEITGFRRMFLAQEFKAHDDDEYKINKHSSTSAHRSKKSSGNTTKLRDLSSAIWSVKFSNDGKYLASGRKDGSISIWKVLSNPVERRHSEKNDDKLTFDYHKSSTEGESSKRSDSNLEDPNKSDLYGPVFKRKPIINFEEHSNDILDLDWSKNGFLVSASMDKSVKLWNIEKKQSLRTYLHPDFVTSIKFLPTDDRFIISGCLDHKCRVWSILDNSVCFEFDCKDLITSLILSPGEGKYTIIGTFNGYIHILETNQLKHITTFHLVDKHTQGSRSSPAILDMIQTGKTYGPRVTSLECFKNACDGALRLVASSNDSKIRIFDLKTRKLVEYLKGYKGNSSQHKVSICTFYGNQFVLSGSDDHWIYAWHLKSSQISLQKNNSNAPQPSTLTRSGSFKNLFRKSLQLTTNIDIDSNANSTSESLLNDPSTSTKRRASMNPLHRTFRGRALKNTSYTTFHGHHSSVTNVIQAPVETSKLLSLSNDLICELTLQYFNAHNIESVSNYSYDTDNSVPSSRKSMSFHSSSTGKMTTPNFNFKNTTNSNSLPNMVKTVGTIIVSTDVSGTIRVFRADLPTEIRKAVLKKIIEYKQSIRNGASLPLHLNSATSFNDSSIIDSSLRDSTIKSSVNYDLSTSKKDQSANDKQGCLSSRTKDTVKTDSSIKQPRVSRVFMNNLFNRSDSNMSNNKVRQLQSNGLFYKSGIINNDGNSSRTSFSITDKDLYNNTNGSSTITNRFRCDICNGTKFEQISSHSGNLQNTYYQCSECGTQLSNLR
ncbi:hypothetical protein TPHA_0G02940 [Tetrapisispora phaffii CBS 4417]|uniref:Uncharacterized protein n=1 Tax=Tetrapisispora phaffii (strain ATCC 24235 / CBS 4417 / NBRC 1672 / NRRL Y-8282 / UCD 70-5) TaxID=1071381 RepID=G8BW57_TETPH|nr:hypothetical protein TPHA_0G02940 [Tetrapisispora phaffii CBS 4417]CCE64135.1 hypothetical protein TPHA_0G02940 [Tetrapisispora phaffii CBS 4417]